MLTQAILKGIADDRLLTESYPVIPTPLRDLIQSYNKLALADASLPVITERTTGAELKAAIRRLSPETQMDLLHNYSAAARVLSIPDSCSDLRLIEEKKIRVLLTRLLAVAIGGIILLVLGGVIVAAAMSGLLQGFLSTQFMATATEIVRFIFSPSKST